MEMGIVIYIIGLTVLLTLDRQACEGFVMSGMSRQKSEISIDGKVVMRTAGKGASWRYNSKDESPAMRVIGVQSETSVDSEEFVIHLSDQMKSDKSWRCSRVAEVGWGNPGYDDSHWEKARVVGSSTQYTPARFIQPSQDVQEDELHFYCRVTFVLLSVMCDDSCEVYADGFLIGSTSTYEELGQFSISQSTRVIAIEADDVGKASGDWRLFGLIVRIKEFISDKSWMCSRDVTHGWNQPVYTMSRSWQRAKTRRKTVQYTPSLFGDVKWIWGSPVNPVFCRGDYNCGCQILCVPGGDGGHHCQCNQGYVLDSDGITCIECPCKHSCINDETGGYYCENEEGLLLRTDGVSCEESLCQHTCVNDEKGGFHCECDKGFILTGDGVNCKEKRIKCLTSCDGVEDGMYESCDCDVYIRCEEGREEHFRCDDDASYNPEPHTINLQNICSNNRSTECEQTPSKAALNNAGSTVITWLLSTFSTFGVLILGVQ